MLLGECLAILVRRNAEPSNEIAAQGLRRAAPAAAADPGPGFAGPPQLAPGPFGADPLDIGAWRLADLVGEHPGEVPGAQRGATRELGHAVCAAGVALDGLRHV